VESLGEKLNYLIGHPDVVEEYRGRAVARVKDAFGWGGIADTYEALFQKLVEIP